MSNVKTQTSFHVNMISKARWILTKGTSLGQILFQLLWNESLFCLSTENIAKKQKKSTYRFVEESLWVFSSGYLQSHTRFGTFTLWSKIRIATSQGKTTFQVLRNEHQCCLSRNLLHENGKGKVHSAFCRGVFVSLFFALSLTLKKVWELSHSDQKYESQTCKEKTPFKFCKMSISAVCHENYCIRMEKKKFTHRFVEESLRGFSSWLSSPSD